mmetsp:Transcript_4133/g.10085  ORF Transcript_4133/g.10085 Transcript_4133/m.10085 type:complete len:80 (+) Transcript_4133:376-615(+)
MSVSAVLRPTLESRKVEEEIRHDCEAEEFEAAEDASHGQKQNAEPTWSVVPGVLRSRQDSPPGKLLPSHGDPSTVCPPL